MYIFICICENVYTKISYSEGNAKSIFYIKDISSTIMIMYIITILNIFYFEFLNTI